MNIRTFAGYLLAVSVISGLVGGAILWEHQMNPPSQTKEGTEIRRKIASGAGTIYDRMAMDALYEKNEQMPPASRYLFIIGGGALLIGLGLFIASPAKEPSSGSGETPASIAKELQTLSDLRDAGKISLDEFNLAKGRLLNAAERGNPTPTKNAPQNESVLATNPGDSPTPTDRA